MDVAQSFVVPLASEEIYAIVIKAKLCKSLNCLCA